MSERLALFRAELGAFASGKSDAELEQLLHQVEWFADFAIEITLRKRREAAHTRPGTLPDTKMQR